MATPAARATPASLLPSALGHVARGTAAPAVPPEAIEALADRVREAHRLTLATGFEHGFLAYLPAQPGLGYHAEDDAVGTRHEIRWHWREREATVAFSFHTHPGKRALCKPSGMDIVGALVRGDHVVYVLTDDGRLSGWRFRDPKGHPRAMEDAMRAIDAQGRFDRGIVGFLYDAAEAMRDQLVEECYHARLVDGELRR